MVKGRTKEERRLLRAKSKRSRSKKCKCGKRFWTIYSCAQHKRICPTAKHTFKPFQPYKPGNVICLRGKSRRKPGKAYKSEWDTYFAYAMGKVFPLWGTIHPKTGNLCICPKKWPNKFEIELFFFLFGKEHLYDNLDPWKAAVELTGYRKTNI